MASKNINVDAKNFFQPLIVFDFLFQDGLKTKTTKRLMKKSEAVNAGTLKECPLKFILKRNMAVNTVKGIERKRVIPNN